MRFLGKILMFLIVVSALIGGVGYGFLTYAQSAVDKKVKQAIANAPGYSGSVGTVTLDVMNTQVFVEPISLRSRSPQGTNIQIGGAVFMGIDVVGISEYLAMGLIGMVPDDKAITDFSEQVLFTDVTLQPDPDVTVFVDTATVQGPAVSSLAARDMAQFLSGVNAENISFNNVKIVTKAEDHEAEVAQISLEHVTRGTAQQLVLRNIRHAVKSGNVVPFKQDIRRITVKQLDMSNILGGGGSNQLAQAMTGANDGQDQNGKLALVPSFTEVIVEDYAASSPMQGNSPVNVKEISLRDYAVAGGLPVQMTLTFAGVMVPTNAIPEPGIAAMLQTATRGAPLMSTVRFRYLWNLSSQTLVMPELAVILAAGNQRVAQLQVNATVTNASPAAVSGMPEAMPKLKEATLRYDEGTLLTTAAMMMADAQNMSVDELRMALIQQLEGFRSAFPDAWVMMDAIGGLIDFVAYPQSLTVELRPMEEFGVGALMMNMQRPDELARLLQVQVIANQVSQQQAEPQQAAPQARQSVLR